nr:immunoglobulin light chain junction region [Macaca mulatta]
DYYCQSTDDSFSVLF